MGGLSVSYRSRLIVALCPLAFAAIGLPLGMDLGSGRGLGLALAMAPVAAPQDSPKTVPKETAIAETATMPRLDEFLRALPEDVRTFNEYLTILASPWMDGRLPGTKGMEQAMDFVEWGFRRAGLQPPTTTVAGAPSYRQPFALGGTTSFSNQTFSAGAAGQTREFAAGTDYNFSTLGTGGDVTGELVFVGYGINNPDKQYMTFKGDGDVDLTGKIAVLLRFEPMTAENKSKWSENGWSPAAGFQGKFANVAARNPGAIIVVNTPGADDPRIKSLRMPGGTMSKAPVLVMSPEAADTLVRLADPQQRSLLALRTLADDAGTVVPLTNAQVHLAVSAETKPVLAENVVGLLPGRGSLKDEIIVMGGHLDHLGHGEFGSRTGPGALHPGADDNASGSAGIMMLAEMLTKEYAKLPADAPLRSILFIAFSAEESGLNGSRHYAQHPFFPIGKHVLMFNYDMIGRIMDDRLEVSGTGTGIGMHEWAEPIYAKAKEAYGLTVIATKAPDPGGSDHQSFMDARVPAVFAILADFNKHKDYHTPNDVSDLINRESAVKSVWLFRDMALDAAQRPKRFEFDANAGPMRPQPMRVRLGVRSREAEDGSGVEIIEVTDGSVAAKAGFKVGDKLIRWAKQPVKNREEFVALLRTQDLGDEAQAVVVREGREETIFVVFPKEK